jgi:hypothetical protein
MQRDNGAVRRAPLLRAGIFFIAILSTALAMAAAGAHALELPNKMALSGTDYFVVQRIYRGWDALGFLLLVELVSLIAAAVFSRRTPGVFRAVLVSILALILAQAVFWAFTFPANVATNNWTQQPENWETLRAQWEYSHLAGAGFQLVALIAIIIAALLRTQYVARLKGLAD